MSESFESQFVDAVEKRDAALVRQMMAQAEFVLLAVADDEDDSEEDGAANVFSTEVDGMDLLVAFTSDEAARNFIDLRRDQYEEDEEIGGYILGGETLLEYMPPEHGLYLNPDTESPMVVDHELLALVQKVQV
ncbi:SseB family protein [Roseiconus lacunae]|uniref:SseB family protein n=1 Tax=Roseiconus lacunae TaxID=2605694 RepID=UPI001E46640E|nr:SseB family protein [Roseiconus lacunae]MCD0460999.1 SseB family protein [Roseiconus lacunae]WRQ48839.1 SseB family protein [Stieleria sp. HD01]